jgi:transposase
MILRATAPRWPSTQQGVDTGCLMGWRDPSAPNSSSGRSASERLIEFLKALRAQIKRPLLIIWDRSQTHRSRLVKQFLESLNGALQLEFLPGYAPELNPVEAIWAHVKPHEMANFLAENFTQLNQFARNRLKSMQRRPRLIAAFWTQAELAL